LLLPIGDDILIHWIFQGSWSAIFPAPQSGLVFGSEIIYNGIALYSSMGKTDAFMVWLLDVLLISVAMIGKRLPQINQPEISKMPHLGRNPSFFRTDMVKRQWQYRLEISRIERKFFGYKAIFMPGFGFNSFILQIVI